MRASLTSATLTMPFARAGATRRSHAARPGTARRRPRSSAMPTRRPGSPSGMLDVAARERLVGLHDLLHELVPHDVAIVEVDERDSVDGADDLHRLDEPGGAPMRQVDLRDVAGDHRLRAEAEARQEHLHLLGR